MLTWHKVKRAQNLGIVCPANGIRNNISNGVQPSTFWDVFWIKKELMFSHGNNKFPKDTCIKFVHEDEVFQIKLQSVLDSRRVCYGLRRWALLQVLIKNISRWLEDDLCVYCIPQTWCPSHSWPSLLSWRSWNEFVSGRVISSVPQRRTCPSRRHDLYLSFGTIKRTLKPRWNYRST